MKIKEYNYESILLFLTKSINIILFKLVFSEAHFEQD